MVERKDRSSEKAGYGSTRARMCIDINGSMFTWSRIAYVPLRGVKHTTAGL